MAVIFLNGLSALFAALAAVFWLISTQAKVPDVMSTEDARISGRGVNLGQINDDVREVVKGLKLQSKWSKWGALFAALAAGTQALMLALG